jgi:DMSO reductase family type II enzyme heme b subunit
MKRAIIFAIITASIGLFVLGTYHALFRYRTFPASAAPPAEALEVPFIAAELSADGIRDGVWLKLAGKDVKLSPQVTAVPWGAPNVPQVNIKAFHNGRQIFFRLEWEDSTEDRNLGRNIFSDACAILFPFEEEPPPQALMMGFSGGANIWQWKAARDAKVHGGAVGTERAYTDYYYPYQEQEVFPIAKSQIESAVEELTAHGVGTVASKQKQRAWGRGLWQGGRWSVVMMRQLMTDDDQDVQFIPGRSRAAAFAVWDGARGDRGARKSISGWVILRLSETKSEP